MCCRSTSCGNRAYPLDLKSVARTSVTIASEGESSEKSGNSRLVISRLKKERCRIFGFGLATRPITHYSVAFEIVIAQRAA